MKPLLRLVFEIGPLVVFFFANAQASAVLGTPTDDNIFYATGAFMAATAIALPGAWLVMGRMPVMPIVSGGFILVFGGLTLALQDELFIKLKPTIVNVLFAVILFGGLARGHPLLKTLMGSFIPLDDEGWRFLTVRWAWFFLFLAGANEIVWRTFSTDFWISFKLFGIMPLTFAFMIAQAGLIQRHATAPLGEENHLKDAP
ncbi:MAG: septation protein A [Parvularculales bacterium]